MGRWWEETMMHLARTLSRAAPLALALLACAAAPSARAQGRLPQACDRACLSGIMDQYLAAMAAHDPSKAPLGQNVKYTENGSDLDVTLGDGLWASIAKLGDQSFRAIDPVSGQVAWQGVAYEHAIPRTVTTRLKVRDKQITEIEQVVTRDAPQAMLDAAKDWKSDPVLNGPAKGKKQARDDMRRRAESYYDAIVLSDDAIAHFTDCTRSENGRDTGKDGSCGSDFKDRRWIYMQTIRPRRISVIDEEQNVVFGFVFLNRRGDITSYTKPSGEVVTMPERNTIPGTTYAGVMIKVENDQVGKVQGIWDTMPYGMTTSWDKDGGQGR
jgi:hypothetical protein